MRILGGPVWILGFPRAYAEFRILHKDFGILCAGLRILHADLGILHVDFRIPHVGLGILYAGLGVLDVEFRIRHTDFGIVHAMWVLELPMRILESEFSMPI
jgi:hypothetical protein